MTEPQAQSPSRTPLYRLHVDMGARMVPFAGYEMPVRYPAGIIAEHRHTRTAASLFDVSHMGQVALRGGGAAAALERLVPGDIRELAPGRMRYTQFTDESGGIIDDLMVVGGDESVMLVVNAAGKVADLAHLRAQLGSQVEIDWLDDRALLALQGPLAAAALARLAPDAAGLAFMAGAEIAVAGIACFVTRSGYTGEDGFEISGAADAAETLARALLAEPEIAPAGLGARDSLRLEAGLCLHGSDIDVTTTPVEAALAWSIGKRRRMEGGFPGAEVIARQLTDGPARLRVGIRPEGRAPARAHTEIRNAAGDPIGVVTSGGFGPTVDGPIAMGYVECGSAEADTEVGLVIRGTSRPARIAALPFVPHRYHRRRR